MRNWGTDQDWAVAPFQLCPCALLRTQPLSLSESSMLSDDLSRWIKGEESQDLEFMSDRFGAL